jgi:sulfur relay (sulfurtransferase) DsrF/TusC family protein
MSNPNEPLPNILFEYPIADVILRSRDDYNLRVPKSYLIHCSTVLDELIRKASNIPDDPPSKTSLPVVQLPESGAVLHRLCTFIFPTTPLVPSTTKEAMKLLSVAQKYQMVPVLAYIRYHIAQQKPSSTQRDDVLQSYALAQKYGLHQEALQAAQTMLITYPMNIEDLEDKVDVMPGASLYELLNYYGKARNILAEDLMTFKISGAGLGGTLKGLRCAKLNSAEVPCWLDDYIASIADTPSCFDRIKFDIAMSRHIWDMAKNHVCMCTCMSSWAMRNFWESLTSVVRGSLKRVSTIEIHELLMRLKPF